MAAVDAAVNTRNIECFHCGETFEVAASLKKKFKFLFHRKVTYYDFFEIDKGREIDINCSCLCPACWSLVTKLTVPTGRSTKYARSKKLTGQSTKYAKSKKLKKPGLPRTRRMKRVANTGNFITMRLVRLVESARCERKQCEKCGTDPSALCIYDEHNYVAPFPIEIADFDIVLNRVIPGGHFIVEENCFNCGLELEQVSSSSSKRVFTPIHELVSPEDCKETFQLQSDLTTAQLEIFIDARLCRMCTNSVNHENCPPSPPPPKKDSPYTLNEVIRSVTNHLQRSEYRDALNSMIRKTRTGEKVFKMIVLEQIQNEMKKLVKEDSVFSRAMTKENISSFSLEEIGIKAKDSSPFISDILTAMFPTAVKSNGKILTKHITEERAQTTIDSRLGLTLGIVLFTHRPHKFNYIQSCLGTKLYEEETSATSLTWLNQAGVTCTADKIRKSTKKMMEGLAPTSLNIDPHAASVSNPTDEPSTEYPPSQDDNFNPIPTTVANPTTSLKPNMLKILSVKEPFRCQICGRCFKLKVSLVVHRRSHNEARPHQCKLCRKAFKLPASLQIHNRIFHPPKEESKQEPEPQDQGPVPTPGGMKTRSGNAKHFGNIEKLHKKSKPSELRPKQFQSLFKRRTAPKRDMPCPVCGMMFNLLSSLNRHVKRIHTADRKHMCHVCLKTFTSETLLENHLQRWHKLGLDKKEGYSGDVIVSIASTADRVSEGAPASAFQTRGEKKDTEYPLQDMQCPLQDMQCPVCRKVFTHLFAFTRHMKYMHNTERTHLCHFCKRTYLFDVDLKKHLRRVHKHKSGKRGRPAGKGTKNRKAGRSADVTPSIASTADTVCEVEVIRAVQTLDEENTQDTSTALCPICGTVFTLQSSLLRHMRTRHAVDDRPFSCQACEMRFTTEIYLQNHLDRCHGNVAGAKDESPHETKVAKKKRRKPPKPANQGTDMAEALCSIASDVDADHVDWNQTGETNSIESPIKKQKKSSETPSSRGDEVVNHPVCGRKRDNEPSLEWNDTGQYIGSNDMDISGGAQHLFSQLEGQLSDQQSNYVQMLALPVGTSTEEGYVSLDGVLDWSTLDEPT